MQQQVRQTGIARWWPRLLLLWMCAGPVLAAPPMADDGRVQLTLSNGLVATARYHHGDKAPAVLMLHGFLQTNAYLTVSSLFSGLADQGYTVLAPTLSLGVDRRRASLDCKAIHTHTLDDDLAEIRAWVAWLEAQGQRHIVLVGHSYGSLKLLAYLADHPSPAVDRLIATSLVGTDNEFDGEAYDGLVARARAEVAAGRTGLDTFRLSYCDNYLTTPQAFLSYAAWTRQRILQALQAVPQPVRVILGQDDRRLHRDWAGQLRDAGVNVWLMPGAGHFFDGQYEFELLDAVTASLQPPPVEQP